MTQELPIERAETAIPDASACIHCRSGFGGHYFEANGAKYCQPCADSLRGALAGQGTSAGRFFRAILLGSGAAALGAIGYGLFMGLTGYEFAYVTIAIGWFIGASVRKGSCGRGGWRYGLLAVLLTYCAIAFSYFGVAVGSEIKNKSSSAPAPALALAHKTSAPVAEDPGKTVPESSKTGAPVSADEHLPSNPVILLVMLFGIAFITPIVAATQSLLSAIIIGFGLWKAWAMNRAVKLEITGPHSVDQLASAPTA